MLRRYLASEAYMYCGETLYNIPWMLLYFSGKYISLWHVRVRKESWLHEFLRERKDLSLFPVISKEGKKILYLCVEKTGKWMDLRLDFVEHEQKYSSKEDTVRKRLLSGYQRGTEMTGRLDQTERYSRKTRRRSSRN